MDQYDRMGELGPFVLDRRRFLLGAAGSAGALLLGACSDSNGGKTNSRTGSSSRSASTDVGSLAPAAGPTVRLPHGAFGFPSPFASNGGFGYIQMSLLYDTLLWKDGKGTLLPWLAARFNRSADNRTYTFELRRNLKWSDGKPLTADDVVFTFRYYAKQQALPPPIIIQPPQGVASVRATSARTVVVTLRAPDVTFAEQVAGALPIVPKHIWSSIADPSSAQKVSLLVGSGPYRLDSYKGDGAPVLYTAVDDYFLGTPFVKRIEFNEVDDEFTALLAGAIDAGGGSGVRSDVLAQFEHDQSFATITERGALTFPLYWNLKKGGALADVKFRQACAMAIDRKDLVTRLAGGHGEAGNPGFLGPSNPFLTRVEQYDLDLRGANALLDAAGYSRRGGTRKGRDGSPLSFELLISNDQAPLAELLKTDLAKIGVELRPKPVQLGPALFGTKLSGGYEMAVLSYPGPSAGGPNADPDLLRQVFSSKSPPSLTSATGYANAKFDELAEQQRATFDETRRKDLVAQMQRLVARDLPVLPLYYADNVLVFRKPVLDQWYFTPGQFPTANDNKQLFVTGVGAGIKRRPTK
jgi:peptide/nickel transport system substrate-binding protein